MNPNVQKTDDHCYAKQQSPSANCDVGNDDLYDVDYTSIFDENGNWQNKHKKAIIHVMDTFHISHEAYHELRHAGKGHFPALGEIIKEKKVMSQQIPYIKHATVRAFLHLLHANLNISGNDACCNIGQTRHYSPE